MRTCTTTRAGMTAHTHTHRRLKTKRIDTTTSNRLPRETCSEICMFTISHKLHCIPRRMRTCATTRAGMTAHPHTHPHRRPNTKRIDTTTNNRLPCDGIPRRMRTSTATRASITAYPHTHTHTDARTQRGLTQRQIIDCPAKPARK